MAYGKKYDIDYKSMADEDYTLEYRVDGWAGSSTEINLGGSGPEIQYETSSQEKFTYILASSLEIPFIVENIGMQDFITDLRDGTYEEQDVYVHLFNSRDTTKPMWSGFILMDLSAKEDVSFPYEVKLTAIDGLSLLKERPFVRDTNTDTGAAVVFPYEKEDVYWNNYDKITDWLQIILAKTGAATTSEGIPTGGSYTYKTSINWYNGEMPSTAQSDDPLYWTQCKMNSLYSKNEDGIYTPQSTYEVLESLCKSWGMRCVYWHHAFHFVQISQYQINESGTTAAPINIPTREYYNTGSVRGDAAYIGSTNLGRYDLQYENVTNVNNAGLQKLAGTQYDYYPTLKKVMGNFNVFEDGNHFNGFPSLDQTVGTVNPIIKSAAIDTFKDAADGDGWFCQIPLNFSNITSTKLIAGAVLTGGNNPRVLDMKVTFSIRAKATGAGSWAKMLVDIGGTLSWVTYDVSTTVGNNWLTHVETNIPTGTSQRIIFDSSSYSDGVIPVNAAFTGDWDFEFFTITNGLNSVNVGYHGKLEQSTNGQDVARAGSSATTFGYSNVFNGFNEFTGIFAEVNAGIIGSNSITNELTTNTSDSYTIELNDLYWGDSKLTDLSSTLRVWNGSAFVKSSDAGEWGLGTLGGTDDFVVLLAKEVMANQSFSSLRMNSTSALSETDKENSGKIKMVNPVGRLKDINSEKYVFLSGTFSTLRDEWNGVWFQQTYNLPTVNTLSNEVLGPISGPTQGGTPQGNGMGMGAQSMMQPWAATTVSTRITAGSITSIPIASIVDDSGTEVAIFKTRDKIFVDDRAGSGQRIAFVINADQSAGATSLTVVAKTIDYDLRVGAIIGIDNENLIQQYQRKTEGQVAGFDIDADGITKGGVEITGWLDADDFAGATANNVPTAESVKAYVDGVTHANNFGMLTCSGTSLTSATDGAANAVVVAYDTETTTSDTNTIILYGATGVSGVSGGEYSFSVTPADHTTKTAFEFSWNVGCNTSVVNNRILVGVKLQQGVDDSGTMVWSDVNPTTSFSYNRGTGSIR